MEVRACRSVARVNNVQVVLRKLGRGSRAVTARLVRAPRSGSVVVIEFLDGLHEYVTTPVKRVLRLAGDDVFFLQTANSCYRLGVRSGQEVILDSIAKERWLSRLGVGAIRPSASAEVELAKLRDQRIEQRLHALEVAAPLYE